MPMKPDAKEWRIREQIIDDPVSGLTIQFVVEDSGFDSGIYRLRLFGDALEFGNREFIFDISGEESGAGTAMDDPRKPSWLRSVPDEPEQ